MNLLARLKKLEGIVIPEPRGVVVIEGQSEIEHQQKIDAMVASGEAHRESLFICLMRFADKAVGGGPIASI